ncbi:MAG: Cna B-type domain-containing protein, partial [Solobacterium sp.]|nr:Cna B-type domain-containing protein [Solobacterium sp.]
MLSFGKKLSKMAVSLLLALTTVITTNPVITVSAAAGDTPPHTKSIHDNEDGTWTLSLDVVGESEKKPNNVNVIVIVDTSGSMDTRTGGYGSATRMEAAQSAVNSLADKLFAYNTTSAPNTVQMALVSFSTKATAGSPTNSVATFKSSINNLDADGGTNWEDALVKAKNVSFGDDDPTFVIFVSDGNPTFRNTRGNYNPMDNYYYNSEGVYGNGSDSQTVGGITAATTISRCYDHAKDDAASLASAVGTSNFYTIGAYGNVDRMQSLTTDAGAPSSNYYSAANTTALQNALSEILAKIEMSGIGNAEITDGTTNQVTTSSGKIELLEVDTTSYKYYKAGQEWADAPEATFENGAVNWDLSDEGVLENGVRYTVTFDVYPSQYTYDTIAKLKNGDLTYTNLDPELKKYIVDNGDGSYSLRTNTNATLSYDDTRDEAGQQEVGYTNPDPVGTNSATMSVTKAWENELDARKVGSINMTVLMDGDSFHDVTLSDPAWTVNNIYVSPGIIKGGKVLEGAEGHDFKFDELGSEQYNWELVTPTVHPMIIDGTLTMLTLVDADHPLPSGAQTYSINGKTYYSNGSSSASLDAYNYRRSNLNLTKVVTGEDAPEDTTFPFTLTVNNSKASSGSASDTNSDYWVWFSIYDTKAGATVTDAELSGTGLEGPNADGYYHIPSGSAITVEMKNGWNIRFTNLPTGTTYTFAEGTLADGFAFNKAELTGGTDESFNGAQTSTGTVQETNKSYTVTYTNDYQLTDLEITKEWVDDNNQDGKRLSVDELKAKLTLSPAVEGKEPTIEDNGDNTYTITYTGLPRFNNGEEVEYTVTESAIDGYTTTGSPAKDHGTITNTHESEKISVNVKKIWDDDDDIGKIRPTSIQVQLKAGTEASGDPVTLNNENEWTYTWSDLPKYKAGEEIVYTADETAVPTGYTKEGPVKSEGQDGTIVFTVTNKYSPTPTTASFPVKKVLSVPDGQTGPTDWTYTINVTANDGAPAAETMTGTVTKAEPEVTFGDFTYTKPGTYTYTVSEDGTVAGVT